MRDSSKIIGAVVTWRSPSVLYNWNSHLNHLTTTSNLTQPTPNKQTVRKENVLHEFVWLLPRSLTKQFPYHRDPLFTCFVVCVFVDHRLVAGRTSLRGRSERRVRYQWFCDSSATTEMNSYVKIVSTFWKLLPFLMTSNVSPTVTKCCVASLFL